MSHQSRLCPNVLISIENQMVIMHESKECHLSGKISNLYQRQNLTKHSGLGQQYEIPEKMWDQCQWTSYQSCIRNLMVSILFRQQSTDWLNSSLPANQRNKRNRKVDHDVCRGLSQNACGADLYHLSLRQQIHLTILTIIRSLGVCAQKKV